MFSLKNIFKAKEKPIESYRDFWEWFCKNERKFYKVIKNEGDIHNDLFAIIASKLDQIKDGFWYLVGMYDDNTAELIFTADGIIKNIVFVEELVAAAPKIDGWKFTALKPPLEIDDVNITMSGYKFTQKNLHFFVNEQEGYPDEIDIAVIYDDYNEKDKELIISGTYVFIDNYLGELDFAMIIDNIAVAARSKVEKELIPIGKLRDYLKWRQNEFVEVYEDFRYDTVNDEYTILEAFHENGNPLVALINADLLQWDRTVSHPWILKIEIPYKGEIDNGMPNKSIVRYLEKLENTISNELNEKDGYLNIGRQTTQNVREIYFACVDFRKPSTVMHKIQKKYKRNFDISFDIYKDKYWVSFNHFKSA